MKYCRNCISPSTRPRIVFSKDHVCNACKWAERKKTIDWNKRRQVLKELCDKYRRNDYFDIICPVSGGKDGSYVAWKMKYEFGMHPLCVTFSPPLQTKLGRQNLEAFRNSGFDLLEIRPNPDVYRRLCKRMFIEQARSKFPFVIGIATAVARTAFNHNIPLIIYGEEGETEYGGIQGYEDKYFIDEKYLSIYRESINIEDYLDEYTKQELTWWMWPYADKTMRDLKITWWSKYESWDDQLHRDLAIEKCGLQTAPSQTGTFTNYAQLDDILQDLHMYECFIKYGHGRATADCNLAIKAGRMTRDEAVEIVNERDGEFPWDYLKNYLTFFNMTSDDFWATIERHANHEILKPSMDSIRPWILKEPCY